MNINYDLNVKQALKILKNGETIEGNEWVGTFSYIGNRIFFTCGEPGCCEFEWTEQEFLKEEKDCKFRVC